MKRFRIKIVFSGLGSANFTVEAENKEKALAKVGYILGSALARGYSVKEIREGKNE